MFNCFFIWLAPLAEIPLIPRKSLPEFRYQKFPIHPGKGIDLSHFSVGQPGLWAATEPLAVATSIASVNADRSRLFLGKVWQLKVTGSSEGSNENYPPMRSIHVGFNKDELKDLVGPLSGGDDL